LRLHTEVSGVATGSDDETCVERIRDLVAELPFPPAVGDD
jgi:hypothetical protein